MNVSPYLVLCRQLLIAVILALIFQTSTRAADVTLQWTANTEPDLIGYKIYYDTNSGTPYSGQGLAEGASPISVLLEDLPDYNNPEVTLTNLDFNITYYIAVTAFDSEGFESDYSNEVFVDIVDEWIEPNPEQDTDGDEIPDDQDDFPFDPDEWLDTDKDGIGNNADPDDDNDKMPDVWEIFYNLNPLEDDSTEDYDNDGISNIAEYQDGTDPAVEEENHAPDQPVLFSPYDGSSYVSLSPELHTQMFNDQDIDDSHLKTQWQISTSPDFSSNGLVLDRTSSEYLTSVSVPQMILNQSSEYYWRARFYDKHNLVSPWAEPFFFTTLINFNEDNNNDGVLDDQEIDEYVDLDRNGIFDINQDDIVCVNTVAGYNQIGLKGSMNVMEIESLVSMDADNLPGRENKPESMPFGYICFSLRVNNPGDTAEVKVYFSEAAQAGSKWYKYDSISGWEDYYDHFVFSADRRSITLELQDGGYGDSDGVPNGVIIDPGGLGFSSDISADSEDILLKNDASESSSSCFIGSVLDTP